MRLIQSKAGMFLRILGSLAIMYFFIMIARGQVPTIPFKQEIKKIDVRFDEHQKTMNGLNTQIKSLEKEREELYLFSSPNDTAVEQKIKDLNAQVETVSAEQLALKTSFEQQEKQEEEGKEKERKKDPVSLAYKYAILLIAGLLLALIFPPEWISFGLIFGSIFIFARYNSVVVKHIGSENIWLYTSIIGALMLVLLLYTMIKKHVCSTCENFDGKKRGFLWTRFYYFLFYGAVIFGSQLLFDSYFPSLKRAVLSKLMPHYDFEAGLATLLEYNVNEDALSKQVQALENAKNVIVINSDITRDGQQEILKLDQQIKRANQQIEGVKKEQKKRSDEFGIQVRKNQLYNITFIRLFALLCLILALFIPIQFFQYFLLLSGFWVLSSWLTLGSWAKPEVHHQMFILYILLAILLFKRQKHICGSL